MGTYEYQRWTEPPAEMIEEVLLRELQASGHYREVFSQRSASHADYVLRGRLYDFKEVAGSPLQARVTVEWELHEVKSGSTVWSHHYTHDEPVSGKDVPAMVAALDHNVQRAVNELKGGLDQYFASVVEQINNSFQIWVARCSRLIGSAGIDLVCVRARHDTLHDYVQHRNENEIESGGGDHPAEHRSADRNATRAPGSLSQHQRQNA